MGRGARLYISNCSSTHAVVFFLASFTCLNYAYTGRRMEIGYKYKVRTCGRVRDVQYECDRGSAGSIIESETQSFSPLSNFLLGCFILALSLLDLCLSPILLVPCLCLTRLAFAISFDEVLCAREGIARLALPVGGVAVTVTPLIALTVRFFVVFGIADGLSLSLRLRCGPYYRGNLSLRSLRSSSTLGYGGGQVQGGKIESVWSIESSATFVRRHPRTFGPALQRRLASTHLVDAPPPHPPAPFAAQGQSPLP